MLNNFFHSFYIYSTALIASGVISFFALYWISTLNEENIGKKEKIARNALFGSILGLIGLLWCVPNTKPLLPSSLHVFLIPAAFVLAWLGYQFLDYLFSRALGGICILLAHYFLHESFTYHTPLSAVFAVFCFVIGVAGLFFAGKPYLFRDMLRNCAQVSNWKYTTTIFLGVFGVFSITVGIMQFVRGIS